MPAAAMGIASVGGAPPAAFSWQDIVSDFVYKGMEGDGSVVALMGKVLAMDEAMSAFVDKVFAPDRIKAAANTVSYTRSRIDAIFGLADRHIDHASRPEAAPELLEMEEYQSAEEADEPMPPMPPHTPEMTPDMHPPKLPELPANEQTQIMTET